MYLMLKKYTKTFIIFLESVYFILALISVSKPFTLFLSGNIVLFVCLHAILWLLSLKCLTSISQRLNVIATVKLFLHTLRGHNKQTWSKHTFTLRVSSYRWGSVEQWGSSSVALSRSLKMLLGVITSDCNQNSFTCTTEAQTDWFHQAKSGQFRDYDL